MIGSGPRWNGPSWISWIPTTVSERRHERARVERIRPDPPDDLKFAPERSETPGMEQPTTGYQRRMRSRDDDGLRSEVGQTLALFGMSLAVVLVGLLVGLGL